ncbi:MAG: hypothetical protein GY750_13715 [Lentisphaerae bacterium]|nr:hypothetical protein [Lentisphaerota bacterium]
MRDKDMVDLSNEFHGWTRLVYKFGCAFIHLSNFHNYSNKNPFDLLPENEQKELLDHLRYYHGGPFSDHPSFEDLSSFFPRVFEKITDHLKCYIDHLKFKDTNCLDR